MVRTSFSSHQYVSLIDQSFKPVKSDPKALICLNCNLTGELETKYCNSDHCPRYEEKLKELK